MLGVYLENVVDVAFVEPPLWDLEAELTKNLQGDEIHKKRIQTVFGSKTVEGFLRDDLGALFLGGRVHTPKSSLMLTPDLSRTPG